MFVEPPSKGIAGVEREVRANTPFLKGQRETCGTSLLRAKTEHKIGLGGSAEKNSNIVRSFPEKNTHARADLSASVCRSLRDYTAAARIDSLKSTVGPVLDNQTKDAGRREKTTEHNIQRLLVSPTAHQLQPPWPPNSFRHKRINE